MPDENVSSAHSIRFGSVRSLVRYVDPSQAVIEVHFNVEGFGADASPPRKTLFTVVTELLGDDGFVDEQHRRMTLADGAGMVKITVVEPDLWWPAGLGEQAMYQLRVSLLLGDEVLDQRESAIGLTSVRSPAINSGALLGRNILVNGQEVEIGSIVPVDQADERQLLPAAGDSLLLVRGHYGPDVLYHAADRAGIMLLQCVPIHPLAKPVHEMAGQIDRLASHPSLIGWFVGHLGALTEDVAATLKRLDPSHGIYRSMA